MRKVHKDYSFESGNSSFLDGSPLIVHKTDPYHMYVLQSPTRSITIRQGMEIVYMFEERTIFHTKRC